jgi:hypothetical protein
MTNLFSSSFPFFSINNINYDHFYVCQWKAQPIARSRMGVYSTWT